MLYGIIMDTIRDGILRSYGAIMWKRIVQEVSLPLETFDFYTRYDDSLVIRICDCMVEILNDGTRDTYLEFFGTNLIHYLYRSGFDKLLRVAGRTFRDFLLVIDQLHDSNRFKFPHMRYPLFHVTEENENGTTLVYKSTRLGLMHFAIGGLKAVASLIFDQKDPHIIVQCDLSTTDYSCIVLRLEYKNKQFEMKRLFDFPSLPALNLITFFRVFPFSMLIDCSLHILHMGTNIMKVFRPDTPLIGRYLNDIFQLLQPDINFEWEKMITYGQHVVFLMENRLTLRVRSSGKIRLKGQMKYIQHMNILFFLCYPVIGSADDMISVGLCLTDLNVFDSTNNLMIRGADEQRALKEIIKRKKFLRRQETSIRQELHAIHKKNQRLLYSTIPKHVALLLRSGVKAYNISEYQPYVTIMFANVLDFKTLTNQLDAANTVACLNKIITLFDTVTYQYNIFKVEIRTDASYMVVAGIHEQSHIALEQDKSQLPVKSYFNDEEKDESDETSDDENKNLVELNSTEIIAQLSLELLCAGQTINNPISLKPLSLKFGFHSGMAIGGIIGTQNYQYCLFGETVKTASDIAYYGEVGRIHLSQAAYNHLVSGKRFTMEYRSQMNIEDKTPIDTYWLISSNIILPNTTTMN